MLIERREDHYLRGGGETINSFREETDFLCFKDCGAICLCCRCKWPTRLHMSWHVLVSRAHVVMPHSREDKANESAMSLRNSPVITDSNLRH